MFTILSKPGCIYCDKTKALLTLLEFNFEEDSHDTPEEIAEFKEKGFNTFPQIYRDGLLIGGFDDLKSVVKEKLQWA